MDSNILLNIDGLEQGIFKAMTLIKNQDEILLDIEIYEVCLMHRFALYLERLISSKCQTYQFDLEYSRYGTESGLKYLPSFYEKMYNKWYASLDSNPVLAKNKLRHGLGRKNNDAFESFYENILTVKDSEKEFVSEVLTFVRPDLIIHHRTLNGSSDNLCVFEAKLKDPIASRNYEFGDLEKIKSYLQDFQYQFGVILNFILMEWLIVEKNPNGDIIPKEIVTYDWYAQHSEA